MSESRPIPNINADPDASHVRLRESGEQLVVLSTVERIHVAPAYRARGFATAESTIWIREGTLAALQQAAASLPDGMSILVWDGLRTLRTQEEIAERFNSSLTELAIAAHDRNVILQKYVSPLPATEEEFWSCPPPHTTGGAIDLSLCDCHGQPLDLGAEFDQFDETAWLTFYERERNTDAASADYWERRRLRRVLYWAMTGAGFAPYPWEFWHFEYRTRRAAAFYSRPHADYGPAVAWQRTGATR